jgi:hypothetical protein
MQGKGRSTDVHFADAAGVSQPEQPAVLDDAFAIGASASNFIIGVLAPDVATAWRCKRRRPAAALDRSPCASTTRAYDYHLLRLNV